MNAKLMSHQSFLVDFMLWLRSLRLWLLANVFGVLSISIVYAFFIAEPKYKSTATFLPPVGAENSFAFLKGLEGFSMSGGQDISPEQIEIIFAGETFGRDSSYGSRGNQCRWDDNSLVFSAPVWLAFA